MPFYADSPYSIPDEAVAVTVDSTSTIGSGGTEDWWGRASIVRRSTDGVLVLAYQRATHHGINDGDGIHVRMSDDNGATWSDEDEDEAGNPISGTPVLPTVSAGEDAGEPWMIEAPNGNLLMFMWRVDYGVTVGGTWMSESADGGDTWSTPTGPLAFEGFGATSSTHLRTFMTDDGFVAGNTIYAAARIYIDVALTGSNMVFVMSDDNGATWSRVSNTIASTTDVPTEGIIEAGVERIGTSRIITMLRDHPSNSVKSWQRESTDMGVTWGSLVDVTSTVGIAGRQRVYTRAHLKGETGWWNDPVLLMVGYEHQTPGSSQDRRNAVWVSRDRGATWTTPFYIDVEVEDAGYGDMFYDADNDQWVVVTYQGTLTAASLKQYRLTIAGI